MGCGGQERSTDSTDFGVDKKEQRIPNFHECCGGQERTTDSTDKSGWSRREKTNTDNTNKHRYCFLGRKRGEWVAVDKKEPRIARIFTNVVVDKKEARIARIKRMVAERKTNTNSSNSMNFGFREADGSILIREICEIRGFVLNTDNTNNTDIVSLAETWGRLTALKKRTQKAQKAQNFFEHE